ncbi:MAG: NAD(P)-dependent oxidoreductase [bacterium]|nr:NAD(P)-dependent oxidoreductase [bacterium]
MENALVTGGSGTIGSYVSFGVKPTRKELDITNKDDVLDFVLNKKPKTIIHLAALTDQRICEENPKEAERINVLGTKNLAEAAKEIGALFVFASTNSVFDGSKKTPYREDDATHPINNYGRSKLEAEKAVREIRPEWIIARTSWVFGGGKNDRRFVGKIIGQLNNDEIKAADDNFGTPTYAKDFVLNLEKLISDGKRGLFHITNARSTSRFDQAKNITDHFGYKGKLIPCSINSFNLPYKNPKNEGLASEFLKLRPWQEALGEYLDENFKNGKK